jgi:hypothetical protein
MVGEHEERRNKKPKRRELPGIAMEEKILASFLKFDSQSNADFPLL